MFEVNKSSFVFYIDKSSPTADIIKPGHNQNYTSSQLAGLDALNGTAVDPQIGYYAGDSLGAPEYKLWDLHGGTSWYFDGTAFQVANPEAWLPVTEGTSPWKRTLGAGVWESDREYFIQARTRDLARRTDGTIDGNIQDSFPYGGVSYHRFIVDDTPPAVFVGTPPP